MEHFAQVVEQIDYKIATVKFDIKETELHLHKQLNAGVPEEHLSDYYSLLDTNEGIAQWTERSTKHPSNRMAELYREGALKLTGNHEWRRIMNWKRN